MPASLDILNCSIGSVNSRSDHSLSFRVNTPELLASQAGELCGWHGRACRVILLPHEGDPETKMVIKTEKQGKTPSQRLRGALYALHQHMELSEPFTTWYEKQMNQLIEAVNEKMQ